MTRDDGQLDCQCHGSRPSRRHGRPAGATRQAAAGCPAEGLNSEPARAESGSVAAAAEFNVTVTPE